MSELLLGIFVSVCHNVQRKPFKVVFSAGESSGEQHAASMFNELKKHQPDMTGLGMGGEHMRKAGVDLVVDSSSIAVIGVVEVIRHYAEIRRVLKRMKQLLQDEHPDLLVCVDYKEFNLKLAQYAKKLGLNVLFYVSPQVWAWRPGRVVTYGKAIDMMAVIFPFETAYYEAENIPVKYVGHPSVDKVKPLRNKAQDLIGFGLDERQPIVGILPGSRLQEIKRILPVMLQAAEILYTKNPGIQFLLPQADSIGDALLEPYLSNTSVPIKVIKNQPYDAIQCCNAVMTTSGTATLEISLLTVPMVIVYKLSELTYQLGRWLVKTPFIGLPNIIAGKAIIKELIQHQAIAKNIAYEIERLLTETGYCQTQTRELQAVKHKLGQGGGCQNTALLAWQMLNKTV